MGPWVVALTLLVSWGPTAGGAELPRTALEYAQDLESANRDVRREAAYQLSRMGRDARVALPQLIRALDDDQQQVWFGAVTALAHLGPEAEPALPALLRDLEAWQPFRRDRQGTQALYRTAVALGSIGPAALPALTNALASSVWHVRAGAAMALGVLGEAARSTGPPLVRLLADDRVEVRLAAAEAVALVAPQQVGALVDLARGATRTTTRTAAIDALRRMGPPARAALSPLCDRLASDPAEDVRVAAVAAVARISGREGEGFKALLQAWRSGQGAVSAAAQQELLLSPAVERQLIPAVIEDLRSRKREAQARAAALIVQLGSAGQGAAAALIDLLQSAPADQAVNPALAAALAALGDAAVVPILDALASRRTEDLPESDWTLAVLRRAGPEALPRYEQALAGASAGSRVGALVGLTALGPAARSVAGLLPGLWKDPDPAVRARAWVAAASCGVPAERVVNDVALGLEDPDLRVRRGALEGLARLGPAARPALPRMARALESGDLDLRLAAMEAMGSLGEEATEAVAPLVQHLDSAQAPSERVAALAALGRIGRPAAGELDRLIRHAEDPDPAVRRAVIGAVGGMGPAGAGAASRLRDLAAGDSVAAVRAAAVEALVAVAPGDEATVRGVISCLEDAGDEVRRAAARAAGVLGERGRPAEAVLFAMLERPPERADALEALKAIQPTSVDALRRALAQEDASVREMAADALARLGKAAAEAVPALERALREDPDEAVKRAARRALRRIRDA